MGYARSRQQHLVAQAAGTGQALVARDQCSVQQARKHNVGGVVSRKVAPQGPYACNQACVPVATDRKRLEFSGEIGSGRGNAPVPIKSAQGVQRFHVQQLRRGQP